MSAVRGAAVHLHHSTHRGHLRRSAHAASIRYRTGPNPLDASILPGPSSHARAPRRHRHRPRRRPRRRPPTPTPRTLPASGHAPPTPTAAPTPTPTPTPTPSRRVTVPDYKNGYWNNTGGSPRSRCGNAGFTGTLTNLAGTNKIKTQTITGKLDRALHVEHVGGRLMRMPVARLRRGPRPGRSGRRRVRHGPAGLRSRALRRSSMWAGSSTPTPRCRRLLGRARAWPPTEAGWIGRTGGSCVPTESAIGSANPGAHVCPPSVAAFKTNVVAGVNRMAVERRAVQRRCTSAAIPDADSIPHGRLDRSVRWGRQRLPRWGRDHHRRLGRPRVRPGHAYLSTHDAHHQLDHRFAST